MLRAIEQARLSIAYPNMNVKLAASHTGLDVGPDGASAQCLEDVAAFRALPNMIVISPSDPLEMELATKAILEYEGPVYMRTGRSPIQSFLPDDYKFEMGKGQILKDGHDITVISCGVTTSRALKAAEILNSEGISVRVVNMSTIKPIDVPKKHLVLSPLKITMLLEDWVVLSQR
jgi:transketolase